MTVFLGFKIMCFNFPHDWINYYFFVQKHASQNKTMRAPTSTKHSTMIHNSKVASSPRKKKIFSLGPVYFLTGTLFGHFISTVTNTFHCGTDAPRRSLRLLTRDEYVGEATTMTISKSTKFFSEQDADVDGWKLIHVFYGDRKLLPEVSKIPVDYFQQVQWFSQVRQDEIVSALLQQKRNGYFVDLASNDAVHISNTYALETNFGWNGLCLEPNSEYWPSLAYRKCNVAGVVIGSKSMEQVRFDFNRRTPAKGGLVGEQFDIKETRNIDEEESRYTTTLVEVFERFNVPKHIDYFSLDVEGAEELVLESFPFDNYRFTILTIERPSKKLESTLKKNGYTQLKKLKKWGEYVWASTHALSSLDMSAFQIETMNYKYKQT